MLEIILVTQFVLVLITGFKLLKKDILFGLFYAVAYLYTLPFTIVYAYFPMWLPESLNPAFVMPLGFFTTASFLLLYFFLMRSKMSSNNDVIRIRQYGQKRNFAIFFITGLSILFVFLLYQNIGNLSYINAYSSDFKSNASLGYTILGLSSTYVSGFIYILLVWYLKENSKKVKRRLFTLLTIDSLALLVYFSLSGHRSSILAILVGVVVIFVKRGNKGFSLKRMLPIALMVYLVMSLLSYVGNTRKGDSYVESHTLLYTALNQDYTAPAMNLVAAMEEDYISPITVISSNIANSLILLKQPFLHQLVGTHTFVTEMTRETGYAFYCFAEGYMFGGYFGILYNAFIFGLLLRYWRRFSSTNQKDYNLFALALASSFLFALVRSQSCYFIKDIYFYFIPLTILYTWVMGYSVNYKKLLFNVG